MTMGVCAWTLQVAKAALAGKIGDRQVRNRGTIGGSIANNDPAACYPSAVLGSGATVVTSKRRIAADDYFTGMFSTALDEGEIITGVTFSNVMMAIHKPITDANVLLIGSNAGALAMEPLGHIAGIASSVLGVATTSIGTVLGGVVGQAYNGTVTPLAFAFGFGGLFEIRPRRHVDERGFFSETYNSKALVAAGIEPGARVGLMSRTRYEWTLIDYAIWAAGAVTVGTNVAAQGTTLQSTTGAIIVNSTTGTVNLGTGAAVRSSYRTT